jgi:hypothetical protein
MGKMSEATGLSFLGICNEERSANEQNSFTYVVPLI